MFHRESGYYNTTYQADMGLYQIPIARWSVIFLALFFFVFVPLTFTEYLLANLNLIGIAIVGALGLNILLGYTGQISIGHASLGGSAAASSASSSASRRCASKGFTWRSRRLPHSSSSNG